MKVVAEIGVNWQGQMGLAQRLVLEAQAAGADVAKFQLYSPLALFGPMGESPNPAILQQISWLEDVTYYQVGELKSFCDAVGIEFAASAFDEERVEWLEGRGVKTHKIASRLVKYNPALCKKILALDKPTYVSLGMWTPTHGPQVNSGLGAQGWPFPGYSNAEYLYCVSKYPAPLAELRFPYDFQVAGYAGFSDHTSGIEAALVAVSRGARVIEKHFTLDKAFPGPDHACSATPAEMRRLVELARDLERVVAEMRGR